MAFDLNLMISEIKEVMADTWTDTAPPAGGIWEIDQLASVSFEEVGGFPYGVVEIPPSEDADWGLSNDAQEVDASFHYVAREDADLSTLRDRLEELKSALFVATFTGMNVLRRSGTDWSARHPANQIFMAKKVPYRAGSLVMRLNFGESAL
jgi:hypothetical protein